MDRSSKLEQLLEVSERMAAAAGRDLEAQVEHCPDWKVRDLVGHIGGVQWFWSNVVEQRIQHRDDLERPSGAPAGTDPVTWFREQTKRLHAALSAANDSDQVWTWWEPDQTIGFVLTRQVNEAVIHCFDACNAVGVIATIATDLAELGLQEFVDVMSKDLAEGASVPSPLVLVPTDSAWRGTLFSDSGNTTSGNTTTSNKTSTRADSTNGEVTEFRDTADVLLRSLWGRATLIDSNIADALAALDLS